MTYSTGLLRHLRHTIGFNIHRLRRQKKMPMGILALRTGLSRELLDHYELGKNEIKLDHMLRIACALESGIAALME